MYPMNNLVDENNGAALNEFPCYVLNLFGAKVWNLTPPHKILKIFQLENRMFLKRRTSSVLQVYFVSM